MKIEETLKKHGITLIEMKTRQVKAIALNINNQFFIGYDSTKFNSTEELENAIKHEFFHLITGTLHRMDDLNELDERAVEMMEEMDSIWN